jgi:hypothetical protein
MTEQMQRPFGIHRIGDIYTPGVKAGLPNGRWVHAPCLPYDGNRFKAAWYVLTGRAYAFLWPKAGELEAIWKAEQKYVNRVGSVPLHQQVSE